MDLVFITAASALSFLRVYPFFTEAASAARQDAPDQPRPRAGVRLVRRQRSRRRGGDGGECLARQPLHGRAAVAPPRHPCQLILIHICLFNVSIQEIRQQQQHASRVA